VAVRNVRFALHPGASVVVCCCANELWFFTNSALLLYNPTFTANIETDPPSTPSTGNVTVSDDVRVPAMYSRGR